MPVLSESTASNHGDAPCSSSSSIFSSPAMPHVLAAFVLISCVVILIRRRTSSNKLPPAQIEHFNDEKKYEYQEPLLRMPRPASPTLAETNLTNVRNLESVPSVSPSTSIVESFEPQQQQLQIDIPRRRSYTKTIGVEKEIEVTGEIVVSPEGWRRHTRVFGGGVCKACEESERRMSA
ncbi:uncharacterized protein LY89DRAFT_732629 [Mollisia scopiformis]|uniref:Uncharacterized protein n=1 Tax=Mollisia scopiformis TaxID=149040 RepID=A0A194XCP3_MOLSC|nr:uncharacterized protein LY89DRAFT_732629 [Mollisia scopiformis]KUJ17921.1 hypothetical protein LY89DRAFT_732629 [Mollisia scopiformis]